MPAQPVQQEKYMNKIVLAASMIIATTFAVSTGAIARNSAPSDVSVKSSNPLDAQAKMMMSKKKKMMMMKKKKKMMMMKKDGM